MVDEGEEDVGGRAGGRVEGVFEGDVAVVEVRGVELADGPEDSPRQLLPTLSFNLHLIENSTILCEFKQSTCFFFPALPSLPLLPPP